MVRAAGIYARISSDRESDRLGVDRQVEDCRRLAKSRGWPVADVYVDNDLSAWSGARRPEYRRLLDDLKGGVIDAVVTWQSDRLHRHPRELEEFFDLCDAAGVASLATVTGDIDLGTHTGQFTARILGAVARKESDDKSYRIRRKHLELATKGKVSGGGTRPYGFEEDRITVRPTEAAIIREVTARALAGDSLRSMCNDLNDRGLRTSTGREWNLTTLRRMLMSARISGQREHHSEIVGDAEWPEIISPKETARLRAMLSDPARRSTRPPRRYLLAGILRCGKCGTSLRARPRQDGTRRYVCPKGPGFAGCGGITTTAEPLEEFIYSAVLYRLDTPELAAALDEFRDDDRVLTDLHQQVVDDQAQLDQLAADYGANLISRREWLAARKPIEERISTTRTRLSRISPTPNLDDYAGNAQALEESWTSLPLSRQQALIKSILDHVVVHPGVRGRNRFDPHRFEPVWRF